ncbi:NAD-dependent 7-alpha-hydroxysteroid dehydrogenase [Aurantiacibacter atlanticus]|uniref:NAD-dependent 7-alpha-hydroxysteroid dehydrogenase n=1 Tax=Aurantiacibacter atlanticus TaxID=1648404 RepID=A0A0H4VD81_9SPHN|nr:7-alpha-hydroxysteroid dehydrogenase [Aurantiacibacter atlanticus]AKQ40796.1 NAD-dependent 7-alpha-hydroxysteroid dehydrogenase [Aurantiacibacter atlanticus]
MFDSHSFRLDGHVALVTGSAAGIGFAIADTFASAGAAVMVSDVDLTAAEKAAARIAKAGGNTAAIACDVTSEEDLERVVDATQAEFGGMTLLVSNAGGGGPKPFEMPMSDFRRAFDLNIFSLFRLAQLAAPVIEESGGGAMLAITSMAGENKNERMASYASSKAATNHLIRNIAFDLGPRNIRINGIAPGAIRTHALETVLTDEIEEAMLAHTPIHRLGKPQDIANAALFLCSDAASWISGEILTVSGGGIQELG